jgi:Rrf2 family protein
MKLSTRSRYGTRLLVDLARHNDQAPIQIGEVSKRQDISVKYLEQLIRLLKRAGFVNSVRGAKGGHLLAKRPEEIMNANTRKQKQRIIPRSVNNSDLTKIQLIL